MGSCPASVSAAADGTIRSGSVPSTATRATRRFAVSIIHRFSDVTRRDVSIAREPRNKTWMTMEASDLWPCTGVAYTIVDEPLLPPDLHVTSPTAYLRWHGHRSAPWYNYHYS